MMIALRSVLVSSIQLLFSMPFLAKVLKGNVYVFLWICPLGNRRDRRMGYCSQPSNCRSYVWAQGTYNHYDGIS